MNKKRKRKTTSEDKTFRLGIKLLLSVVYLIIITILFVCAYKIYEENNSAIPYSEASSTSNYVYVNISKMSEKFAYNESNDIGMHFIIEKEETGIWHTYVIAIKEKELKKYEEYIKYAKGELGSIPTPKKVYGYPVNISNDVKTMAINNINKFLPSTNEVEITNENYEEYLTNSYIDTTIEKKENISVLLVFIMSLIIVVIILLILTLIDKNVFVDNIEKRFSK